MFDLIQIALLIFLTLLAIPVLYLLVLTAAAWGAKRQTRLLGEANEHFVFLIPAHNEEKLLPECLDSLKQIDYPAQMYQILVVADNCTDGTAHIARQLGATVTERTNEIQRGKGYALEWGLKHLWEIQPDQDHLAIIILDADTSVSKNFLRVMAAHIAQGERVIQSYYSVRNAEHSWSENLRYIALAVLHYLRPQGRMVLGGSAGLKGNGMVFTTAVLQQHRWSESITEDIEFHMSLLLNDERVTFAPDAVVWGEMPNSLTAAKSQLDRWERGRMDMATRYIPRLLQAAWSALLQRRIRWAYALLDAIMEFVIPPFSILMGLSALGLFAAGIAGAIMLNTPAQIGTISLAKINLVLAIGLLAGQLIYVFSGLKFVKAPASAYRTLLYAPLFVAWKIWRYIQVILTRDRQEWIRTARNGG